MSTILPPVMMLHEQTAPATTFMPTTSLARHFPTSVLQQEQRDESRLFLKEEKTSQVTSGRRRVESGFLEYESIDADSDQYLKDFQHEMLNWPGLWYLLPSNPKGELSTLPSSTFSALNKTKKLLDVEPHKVLALANKALSASKQAALLAEEAQFSEADVDESHTPGSRFTSFINFPLEEKTVSSTRLLERRSRKRRVTKPKVMVEEARHPGKADVRRKLNEEYDPNDPLRLFLWGPETKRLLTLKEESELIIQIQDHMKLEEVRSRLQSHFEREPTLVEWASAVGLSCPDLKFQLHCGNKSREKLINANLRMVVHIAKQYQRCGLNLQDLLQEGSMGLMKSVEKFKPQAGCRFATYAYWWIRQSIRKAIFRHSRTIRLPDNVYGLLHKITEVKRLCVQEGNHQPSKEEIAARAGITVEKLESLLYSSRMPLSMQQPVWMDQDTTFQEITADTAIEVPDVSVAKKFMRQHVRHLLSILGSKERQIIHLRFGIGGSEPKSLSEIGAVFGLSKERVRQLEARALYKLKQHLGSQGLDAYADLLN